MTKPSGDRDLALWMEVWDILASLLLFVAMNLQGQAQTASLSNNGRWKDFGDAFAMPCASGDLWIPPNIDPEGEYNDTQVDQLRVPAIQDTMDADEVTIDADEAAAAEADLSMWLAVAEVASLPRQIERDEANMMVRRLEVPSSVTESGVAPSSLVDGVAAAPQHLPPQAPVPETVAPEVVGVLPHRIEDEDEAHAQAQVEGEVAIEALPPGMLELISDVARLPQFATPSMTMPAGGLESNLEERMPVDHPEAGDSSAGIQAEMKRQDDVENLEVEEPDAKDMQ